MRQYDEMTVLNYVDPVSGEKADMLLDEYTMVQLAEKFPIIQNSDLNDFINNAEEAMGPLVSFLDAYLTDDLSVEDQGHLLEMQGLVSQVYLEQLNTLYAEFLMHNQHDDEVIEEFQRQLVQRMTKQQNEIVLFDYNCCQLLYAITEHETGINACKLHCDMSQIEDALEDEPVVTTVQTPKKPTLN